MIYGNRFLNESITINESQITEDEYKEYMKIVKNMIDGWIDQINITKSYLNKVIKLFNNPKENMKEIDNKFEIYENEYSNSYTEDNSFLSYKRKYGILKIKDKDIVIKYKEKINQLSKLNDYFDTEKILNKLKSKYDESEETKCLVIYNTYFSDPYNEFKTDIETTIQGIKQFL